MRNILITLFIALTILNLIVYVNSPDRVVSQFGARGQPTDWMTRQAYFYIMQGTEILLFLLFFYLPGLIVRIPVRWINMPHREYWLAPENRDKTKKKLGTLMPEMGVYLFLFLGTLTLLTFRAHQSETIRLDMSNLWLILAVFLGLTAYWSVKFYKAFKNPNP